MDARSVILTILNVGMGLALAATITMWALAYEPPAESAKVWLEDGPEDELNVTYNVSKVRGDAPIISIRLSLGKESRQIIDFEKHDVVNTLVGIRYYPREDGFVIIDVDRDGHLSKGDQIRIDRMLVKNGDIFEIIIGEETAYSGDINRF